jgi:uncharacterized RDD family membrane protein YckC
MEQNTRMTSSFPSAPLWRRLTALCYDSFLLFAILMLYGYAVVFIKAWATGIKAIEQSPTAAGNFAVFIGMVCLVIGFYCVFWLKNRQTLGMQAWRIQLETTDSTPLTLKHCLRRAGVAILSLACFGLGYLWCLFPGKSTWHDTLSGTRVVVHPKRT